MINAEAIRELKQSHSEVAPYGKEETLFFRNSQKVEALKFPELKAIKCYSLTQFVNAVKAYVQSKGTELKGKVLVNVTNYNELEAHLDVVNENKAYEKIAESDFHGKCEFDDVSDPRAQDEFFITVMKQFQDTEQREELLRLCSSLKAEKIATSEDDGVSQTAAVKAGVHLSSKIEVKNNWVLKAQITFPEVEQPEVPYFLRLHQSREETPRLALYERDGGKWKVELTKTVRDHLVQKFKGELGETADKVIVL
jgi:hypothetical protein